jgi:hypothetical protein
MHKFFSLPYFKRVWIFQELVLTRLGVFMYKTLAISHEAVEGAARWLVEMERSVQQNMTGGGMFES